MSSAPVNRAMRALTALVAMACMGAATASHAADVQMKCGSLEEAEAFRLRHLQSRLMVAALGCNQQAAYNAFVEHFRPTLAAAGGRIIAYFVRTGGGQAALNRHITELANSAGLSRAEDPDGYCKGAWELFWSLEQDPLALSKIADANTLQMVSPQSCTVTVAAGAVPPAVSPGSVSPAPDTANAAADNTNK
jgi:hypothetical protein